MKLTETSLGKFAQKHEAVLKARKRIEELDYDLNLWRIELRRLERESSAAFRELLTPQTESGRHALAEGEGK